MFFLVLFSLKWSCIVQRPIQTEKDWGGVDCRILESDLRLRVEIKIVLWQRLSSLCAPLYYNKNSHVLSYCCDPVVDEKRYYHAVKIIKKKKLHNCYKKFLRTCRKHSWERPLRLVFQSVPLLQYYSTSGCVCVWLLNYGSLYSSLALPPNRVGLCFVPKFSWIPLWQQTIVVRVEKLYTWLNEEWVCIVKASRLLVKITVTEIKERVYRYSM